MKLKDENPKDFPSRPPHGGRGLKFDTDISAFQSAIGRPPHGGRGLKFGIVGALDRVFGSPSPRRAWIEIV